MQPAMRTVGQILTTLWAAFWTWFCVSVAASEGGQSIAYASGIIGIALAVAATAWWRPKWGGPVLVATGIFAAWFFQGAWAWLLMAAPPVVAGLLILLAHRRSTVQFSPA